MKNQELRTFITIKIVINYESAKNLKGYEVKRNQRTLRK